MSDLSPQEFNQSALQALVNSSQSIHSPMQLVASITGDASLAGLFRAQAVAQGAYPAPPLSERALERARNLRPFEIEPSGFR